VGEQGGQLRSARVQPALLRMPPNKAAKTHHRCYKLFPFVPDCHKLFPFVPDRSKKRGLKSSKDNQKNVVEHKGMADKEGLLDALFLVHCNHLRGSHWLPNPFPQKPLPSAVSASGYEG
jgi:hypothetical protein